MNAAVQIRGLDDSMKFAIWISVLSVASAPVMTLAAQQYGPSVSDVMIHFIYGAIALVLVAFTGSVGFIVLSFHSSIKSFESRLASVERNTSTLAATCAERSKHCSSDKR